MDEELPRDDLPSLDDIADFLWSRRSRSGIVRTQFVVVNDFVGGIEIFLRDKEYPLGFLKKWYWRLKVDFLKCENFSAKKVILEDFWCEILP